MSTTAILDVDGTLVDTNYHHAIAWFRAFRRFDVTEQLWRIHRHIGMGGDQLVAAVAGDEVEERCGDDIREAESELYKELIGEVRTMEGSRELIVDLGERGNTVVLASSAKEEEIDHYLDLLDAREIIESWTTSDDVEQTKPKPDLRAGAPRRRRARRLHLCRGAPAEPPGNPAWLVAVRDDEAATGAAHHSTPLSEPERVAESSGAPEAGLDRATEVPAAHRPVVITKSGDDLADLPLDVAVLPQLRGDHGRRPMVALRARRGVRIGRTAGAAQGHVGSTASADSGSAISSRCFCSAFRPKSHSTAAAMHISAAVIAKAMKTASGLPPSTTLP